jgi:hypothetical protein
MPRDDGPTVLLGDLNDRGPRSREVIEFAMSEPGLVALHSNHGHMFADWVLSRVDPDHSPIYHPSDFFINGGAATLLSYGGANGLSELELALLVPRAHIRWLTARPRTMELGGLLMSHAPIPAGLSLREARAIPLESERSVIWSREAPSKRRAFQAFGHNSHWGLLWIEGYAVCLDASRGRVLTGMHWPSKRIYQVPF